MLDSENRPTNKELAIRFVIHRVSHRNRWYERTLDFAVDRFGVDRDWLREETLKLIIGDWKR